MIILFYSILYACPFVDAYDRECQRAKHIAVINVTHMNVNINICIFRVELDCEASC